MPQFELLVGRHVDGTGDGKKVYEAKKGGKKTIVDSDLDLDKLFAEKFRRLDGPTKKPRDRHDGMDDNGKVSDEPLHKRMRLEEKKAVPQKKKFRSSDYAPEEDDDGDDVFKDDDEGVSEVSGRGAMKARAAAASGHDDDDGEEAEESHDGEFSQEDDAADVADADGDDAAEKPARTPVRRGKKVVKAAKKVKKSHR